MTKKTLISKLNRAIEPFVSNNRYFETLGGSMNGIANVLNDMGINHDEFYIANGGNQGQKNFEFQTPLGKIYLSYNWYKMESGRWEVVAYFN